MSLNEQPFQSRLDRLSKPSAVVFESDLPGKTYFSIGFYFIFTQLLINICRPV